MTCSLQLPFGGFGGDCCGRLIEGMLEARRLVSFPHIPVDHGYFLVMTKRLRHTLLHPRAAFVRRPYLKIISGVAGDLLFVNMSGLVESVSKLPTPTRYITTHDNVGNSIFAASPPIQYHRIGPDGNIGGAARLWAAESVPTQLSDDADLKAYFDTGGVASYTKKAISIDTGVTLIVIDFLPGVRSQMHQTVSLDFFVCLGGVLELELDSGQKKTIRPGDHIIQRATMHRWFNPSESDSARLMLVTVGAAPFDVAGKPMREVFLPPSSGKQS